MPDKLYVLKVMQEYDCGEDCHEYVYECVFANDPEQAVEIYFEEIEDDDRIHREVVEVFSTASKVKFNKKT
mgnify:CR=1 FL=1|jgi:hypothetical protein